MMNSNTGEEQNQLPLDGNNKPLPRVAEMNHSHGSPYTSDYVSQERNYCPNNNKMKFPCDGSLRLNQTENINQGLKEENVEVDIHQNNMQDKNSHPCNNYAPPASNSDDIMPPDKENQSQCTTDLLLQLSQAAAQRLQEDKTTKSVHENLDGNINQIIGEIENKGKSMFRTFNQKKRNLEGDVLGNCLHTSPKATRNTELTRSHESKNISSCKNKKDKSHLRKGKWIPEEEEYTSRMIHHFRSGLLRLPEGTTLRSFIAQKLGCDPMRITKKFAGASCLGKRVYHLHERSQFTCQDIDMAKAELNELERRFRLRVDEGNQVEAFSAMSVSSFIDSVNQSNLSNQSTNTAGFTFMHPSLNINPTDPMFLAKYVSTIAASPLGSSGVSAFFLQLLAAQQMQQPGQIQQQQQSQIQQQQQQQQASQTRLQQASQIQLQQSRQTKQQQQIEVQQQQLPQLQYQQQLLQQQSQKQNSLMGSCTDNENVHGQFNQTQCVNLQYLQQLRHAFSQHQTKLLQETNGSSQQHINQQLPQQTQGNVVQQIQSQAQLPQSMHFQQNNNSLAASQSNINLSPAVTQHYTKCNEARMDSNLNRNLPIHHAFVETHPNVKPNDQFQRPEKAEVSQSKVSGLMAQSKLLSFSSNNDNQTKHSKEDVDAGNTLLIFLNELRKNHDQAMAMSNLRDNKDDNGHDSVEVNASTNKANMMTSSGGTGNMSVSTAGLVSETSDNSRYDKPNSMYLNNIRSIYVNKDESPTFGYTDTSSSSEEEQQKLHSHQRKNGPVKKRGRFR